MTISFAIVVPCYNDPQGLRITIQSIERNNTDKFCCYVYDDGSSSEQLSAIFEVLDSSPLKVGIVTLPRGNATRTRNRALMDLVNQHDAIVWMDSGDEFDNDHLLRLERCFADFFHAGHSSFVLLPSVSVKSEGHVLDRKQPETLGFGRSALLRHLTFKSPITLHQGGLVSSRAIQLGIAKYGSLYAETQQNGPDFLAITRLIGAGAFIQSCEEIQSSKNVAEDTTELGTAPISKLVARYPDFEEGMRLQNLVYCEHFKSSDFIHNSLAVHFYRRSVELANVSKELSTRARDVSLKYSRWGESLSRLWEKCVDSIEVTNLYKNFPPNASQFFYKEYRGEKIYFNKELSLLTRLLLSNTYEPNHLDFVTTLCVNQSIDTVLDVGAGNGVYSVILAAIATIKNVYAFEPSPRASDLLRKTIDASHDRAKITQFECALSDYDGQAILLTSSSFAGANRLEVPRSGFYLNYNQDLPKTAVGDDVTYDQSVQVQLRALDSTLRLNGKRIFYKIDAEGSEYSILRGSQKFLQSNCCIIQVEESDFSLGMVELLRSFNYEFFHRINRDSYFRNFYF